MISMANTAIYLVSICVGFHQMYTSVSDGGEVLKNH